jgi:hypothetical protein
MVKIEKFNLFKFFKKWFFCTMESKDILAHP